MAVLTDAEIAVVCAAWKKNGYESVETLARHIAEAADLKVRLMELHCPDCHRMMVPKDAVGVTT